MRLNPEKTVEETETDDEDRILKVTTELSSVSKNLKKLEKQKKDLRLEFLALVTDRVVAEKKMNRQNVHIEYSGDIFEYFKVHYPAWNVLTLERVPEVEPPVYDAVLEEKPECVKYSYVNPETNEVFPRQIAMVGSKFNAEAFWNDDEEVAAQCVDVETITTYTLNEKKAETMLTGNPSLMSKLQQYSSPGKPQIKLGSIREAKDKDTI